MEYKTYISFPREAYAGDIGNNSLQNKKKKTNIFLVALAIITYETLILLPGEGYIYYCAPAQKIFDLMQQRLSKYIRKSLLQSREYHVHGVQSIYILLQRDIFGFTPLIYYIGFSKYILFFSYLFKFLDNK